MGVGGEINEVLVMADGPLGFFVWCCLDLDLSKNHFPLLLCLSVSVSPLSPPQSLSLIPKVQKQCNWILFQMIITLRKLL